MRREGEFRMTERERERESGERVNAVKTTYEPLLSSQSLWLYPQ